MELTAQVEHDCLCLLPLSTTTISEEKGKDPFVSAAIQPEKALKSGVSVPSGDLKECWW